MAKDIWLAVKILTIGPGIRKRETRIGQLMAGFILLSTAVMAIFVSYMYNFANAKSSTEAIINSVILLFVNSFDESCHELFEAFFSKLVT